MIYMKSIIKYGIITVIASIAIIYTPLIYTITLSIMQVEPNYKEPEMNIEEYGIKQGLGYSSRPTVSIADVKEHIAYTIRGEVIAIREPIIWVSEGMREAYERGEIDHQKERGAIPVDILIKDVYKGDLNKGEIFTIYVDSFKVDDTYYTKGSDASFVVGEEVIVHVTKPSNVTNDLIDTLPYTALGKYGKYTIKDDFAYNEEKYPYGVPMPYIAYEALP